MEKSLANTARLGPGATRSAQAMAAAVRQMGAAAAAARPNLVGLGQGLSPGLAAAQAAAQGAGRAIGVLAGTMKSLGVAAMAGARQAAHSIESLIVGAANRARGAVGRLTGAIRGIGRGAAAAIGGVALLGSIATAAFGIAAVKNAAQFQEQLGIIKTIAQDLSSIRLSGVNNDIYDVGEALQDVAIRSGQAVEDLTAAEYEFLSAGIGIFKQIDATGKLVETINWEQSYQALNAAAELAVGGLSTQTEAVTLLSFALNSYNLNQERISAGLAEQAGLFIQNADGSTRLAESMGEASEVIADQFAKAIEIGVVTASQIAGSFATVSAGAKIAGIGLNEISAAYASQTVRGVSAARVTVSMNRAIQDLLQPSARLKDLMEETGKNYLKIADTKGIHVAFQEMRTDANALGFSYRDLFKRQEGWRFALNITQDDLADAAGNFRLYQLVLQQINESTGASEEQMLARTDTVVRNFGRLNIAFKILSETIGRPLLQPINEFLKALTGLTVSSIEWARANQQVIGSIAPIIGAVAALISLSAGTQGLLYVLQRVGPLIGTTGTGLSSIARVVSRIVVPLGLVVGAFGAFRFAVQNSIRGFGQFRHELEAMESLARGVVEVFATIADGIGRVWAALGRGGNVGGAVRKAFDEIGQAVENLGPAFERTASFLGRVALTIGVSIVHGLQAAVPAILGWASDVIRTVGPRLLSLAEKFVDWVAYAVPRVIAALSRFVGEVGQNISAAGPTIVNALSSWAAAFSDWAAETIPVVVRALSTMLGRIVGWILEVAPRIVDALASWGASVAQWFANEGLPAITSGLNAFLTQITDYLASTQVISNVVNAIATWASAVAVALGAFIAQSGPRILATMVEIGGQIITGLARFLIEQGPRLAAAAVVLAAQFLVNLGAEIVRNPGLLVNAFGILLAGAAIQTVFFVKGLLAAQMYARGFTAGNIFVKAILGLWHLATPLVTAVATGVGKLAGLAYQGAVRVASFIGAIISYLWQQALLMGLAPSAAAGTAHGAAYARARSAAMAGVNILATLLGTGGVGAIAQQMSGAGTLAGQVFGRAMSLAMGAAAVLGVAYLADAIAPHVNKIGQDIHNAIFQGPLEGVGNALEDFGKSWQNWRENTDWPLGQRNAPEWAGGKPIPGPVIGAPTFEGGSGVDISTVFAGVGGKIDKSVDAIKRGLESGQFILEDGVLRMREWWDEQPPIDIGDVLKAPAEQAQEAAAATQKSFDELVAVFEGGSDRYRQALQKFQEGTYKSDAERLAALRQARRETVAEIERAKAAGDSGAVASLQGLYDSITNDITTLQNASSTVTAKTAEMNRVAADTTALDEYNAKIATSIANAARLRELTNLGEIGQFAEREIPPIKMPAPEPLSQAEIDHATKPYQDIRANAVAEMGKMPNSFTNIADWAMRNLKNSIGRNKAGAQSEVISARNLMNSVWNGTGVSWWNFGAKIVQALINGMNSKKKTVQQTAQVIATVAGSYFKASSPPKEGPLKNIDRDGANIVKTIADAMMATADYARLAGYTVASAAASGINSGPRGELAYAFDGGSSAFMGGPRQIAPVDMGYRGRATESSFADRIMWERQTDLLGQIAAASSLGAEASSRLASTDPIAGGPLAARGTLSALRHLQHGREH